MTAQKNIIPYAPRLKEPESSTPIRGKSTGVFVEKPYRPGKADRRDEGLPIDFPIPTPNWSLVSSHVIPCHVAMSRSSNSAMYEPAKMCRRQVALMSILTHATWLQKVQKDDFWGAIYLFSSFLILTVFDSINFPWPCRVLPSAWLRLSKATTLPRAWTVAWDVPQRIVFGCFWHGTSHPAS